LIRRNPGPAGYSTLLEAPAGELIAPLAAPQLAIRLADLDLGSQE
jgi:hypothetical protein